MRVPLLVALLAACGPGIKGAQGPQFRNPHLPEYAARLSRASQQHDVAAIRKLMRDQVTIGGLWFQDVACMKQFSFPAEVRGAALDELARCLTTLGLEESPRGDSLPDVVVLNYAPGIEIEARFIDDENDARLMYVGFSSRRDLQDALPTISRAALESLRTAGDPKAPLVGPGGFDELTTLNLAYAWMKVCIDATGAVTGVHVREATSHRAARTFAAAVRTWQFRPFMLDSQPTPVCSMVRMKYPTDEGSPREWLPVPVPDMPEEMINVPSIVLGDRVSGALPRVTLHEMLALEHNGIFRLTAAYQFCVDTTGHVSRVVLLRPSRFLDYDRRTIAAIHTWVYRPFLDDGKPVPICALYKVTTNLRTNESDPGQMRFGSAITR